MAVALMGSAGAMPSVEIKTEDVKSALEKQQQQQQQQQSEEEAKKSKFGFPASQAANYSVSDCRALVKTLVCGVKTITWGCTTVKVSWSLLVTYGNKWSHLN